MALKATLLKELDLLLMSIKLKTMDRMEDSAVFWIMTAGVLVRMFFGIVFFKSIFAQVQTIGGWDFFQVMVLMGTWEAIHNIAWATYVRGGFNKLYRLVERGDLDLYLVRPLQLRSYFLYENIDAIFSLPQLAFAIGLIVYGAAHSGMPLNIPVYLLLFCAAMVIHYSLACMASSVNFWSPFQNSHMILTETTALGRYPITIYKGLVRLAFTILVPLACIYTFPVQALFGQISWTQISVTLSVAFIFFSLSTVVWNAGLRRYESAGY